MRKDVTVVKDTKEMIQHLRADKTEFTPKKVEDKPAGRKDSKAPKGKKEKKDEGDV